MDLRTKARLVEKVAPCRYLGRVERVAGILIEAVTPKVSIGEICYILSEFTDLSNPGHPRRTVKIPAEVVGIDRERTYLMPFEFVDTISAGAPVETTGSPFAVRVGEELLGRVLNGLGIPIDQREPVAPTQLAPVVNRPPRPLERPPIRELLSSGIKSIDCLVAWGKGQRLGIFSGSGVGKSTLLGMIARNSSADVNVIALIGERGREVREFVERDLGEEGLAKSVVVAVTSDESPIMRLKGSLVAHTIAEYFRDRGKHVLLLMDSLTRYAYALREVGLALGEPPTTRGYTPSVYARIPQLCERAGLTEASSITAVYTVLVEGDDLTEPVSDIARSVLDGHITLSRRLANEGFYPPVEVLDSVSRLMYDLVSEEHRLAAQWARQVMATYREAEELINIGAYQRGNNPRIDHAVDFYPRLMEFLRQDRDEKVNYSRYLNQFIELWRSAQAQA